MARTRIKPVHPGAYLREVLEDLGVSQYRDVTEEALGKLVEREVQPLKAVA